MAQSPKPGGKVRRGWVVRVAESLGPQRATIPDVIGESQRAAEINIQRRGLDVGTTSIVHLPDLPADQIVAQSPPAEAYGVVSPKVNLLINASAETEAYVMPDLVGRRFGDASKAIADAGMHVAIMNLSATGVTSPADPVLDSATVTRQSPTPGQKVAPGATIALEISR